MSYCMLPQMSVGGKVDHRDELGGRLPRRTADLHCRAPALRFSPQRWIRAKRSSSGEVIFRSDDEELGLGRHTSDEGVAPGALLLPLDPGDKGRVDWPGEGRLCRLESGVEVRVGEVVGDMGTPQPPNEVDWRRVAPWRAPFSSAASVCRMGATPCGAHAGCRPLR